MQNDSGILKRVAQGLYRSTASGTYFAHLRIGGKLFRESLKTDDRKIAETELAKFRDGKRKLDPNRRKVTVAQLCDRYAETLGHLASSTRGAKVTILDAIKREWPGGSEQLAARVKPSDCDVWLGSRAERVGKSHFNASLQLVRDLFDFAERDGIVPANPAKHRKYLKREKRRGAKWAASYEHWTQIVENMRSYIPPDLRAQRFGKDARASADFVEFIGRSGLGKAETAALRWQDVDFAAGHLTTYRHKTRTAFEVPLFPQLRPLLERMHEAASQRDDDRQHVFAIKDAKKAIESACARLKLPRYTHISFRRMFITRAIEKGVDVKVISEWQGHQDGGKLILDTYSHVNRAHANRMALLMTDVEPDNVIARIA